MPSFCRTAPTFPCHLNYIKEMLMKISAKTLIMGAAMTIASTATMAETKDYTGIGGNKATTKTTNTQQAKPAPATRKKTARAGKTGTKRSVRRAKYLPMARSMKPAGLPISLVDAVITMESGYNPAARGAAGEIGLMQVKPATARMVRSLTGVRAGSLSVPANNLRIGMAYLNWCYKRAKRNVAVTIGCYNAGPGNMWKWQKFAVTRKYVSFVRKRVN
jgi:soluble lytic murein transglycosylase-like protein